MDWVCLGWKECLQQSEVPLWGLYRCVISRLWEAEWAMREGHRLVRKRRRESVRLLLSLKVSISRGYVIELYDWNIWVFPLMMRIMRKCAVEAGEYQ